MSPADRVNLPYAALSRRGFFAGVAATAIGASLSGCRWASDDKVLNVYSWSDYIAPDTISKFEAATGIMVRYDVYDSNETLDAKLSVGSTGYDVVIPSAMPFLARQIRSGRFRELDKSLLPNLKGLDSKVLEDLNVADPGNRYGVPYLMAATGIGVNRTKVEQLAPGTDLTTLGLLFDPVKLAKLKRCGVSVLDAPVEVLPAALSYLGRDPKSLSAADLEAAGQAVRAARANYRYVHSSSYINDLASGEICVAQGWVGDLVQARSRANEAGRGVEIEIVLPKEGASFNVDMMAIPKDAPHVANAYAFIDFILQPQVIGAITNAVGYANAVPASKAYVDKAITSDPAIYPPAGSKLYIPPLPDRDYERARNRLWTEIRGGV